MHEKEGKKMRIEEFWEDKKSYHISFLNIDNVIVNRIILLSPEIEEKSEIENIIYSSFGKVKRILEIDEWDDVLLLKEFAF